LNVGENVEAVVLEVDVENKRISLGLKQLQPNPWDDIEAKYPMLVKKLKVQFVHRRLWNFR
jgi:small subunit ribosomal protein S1